jgi:hypothetical protein
MLICALAVMQCTGIGDLAGAGTETTNSLTGIIAKADGGSAPRTLVLCIPQSYDVVKNKTLPASSTDTTDQQGRYHFSYVDTGTYTIQAVRSLLRPAHCMHREQLKQARS